MRLPNKKYRAKTIVKWLWQSSSDNRLQAILNTAIGLAQVVVSLASVWAVQTAIDIASHNKEGDVISAVLVMAGLVALNFVLNISSVWVRNILGIKAQNRMQRRMLGRILHSEWQGRDSMHSGDVLNRLEQDVNNVVNFVAETLPNAVSVVALFLGAFVYLFTMDHSLALIIVVMFPIFLVLSKIYMGKMRQLTREVRESDSQVQSLLQESVQNRILVKTLESEDEIVDRLSDQHSALREKVVKKTRFSVISNLIVNVGFATGYLVAFAWSALRMSVGSLSYGGMTAFLQLVNKIQGPARNLTKLVPAFVSVFTAAERLMELEENPLEEQGEPILVKAPCGVRFTDVSYAYDEKEGKVIDHLSFDFKPGSCTAILGETGSGKTTLVRMILALLRPQEGKVEIYNAKESKTLSPRMRCNFVYVPQGNTLMSGTIRDNLRLGKLNASEERMREALHKSCADFVFDLPEGLDTVCTEAGGGLSEGQAQRIAIARALLRNRAILLFDEATSALDPDTERQLLKNILASHDRTIIFITHRPAVVDYCDQTLRVEKRREM